MIKRIVIVGGGSTGWMCAAWMSKHLPAAALTLIESSDIPIIGVGESTVPPIRAFMDGLGLKEKDWMPQCNAVFKSSICFKGFHAKEDPHFWFPFQGFQQYKGRPLNRYWLHNHWEDPAFSDRFSFYDYCYQAPEICRQGKTVAAVPGMGYAYHFDAGLLGDYLKHYACDHGVQHVVDTVTTVNQREDGSIASISRQQGDDLAGDLFIDCTGFRSLLLGKTLSEPFLDYGKYLFNDRAVAMRVPYDDKAHEMRSYTLCDARSAGWIWTIPLYSRIGTGYVYSSRHQSQDDAELEFRRYWGEERVKDVQVNHLRIRVGRHQRSWVKNCVAMGLASGFIEPLESTGLFIAQGAIQTLTDLLKDDNQATVADVKVYNDSMTRLVEIIRDFLICHYALTGREDSAYWRDVKFTTEIPDGLSEKLQLARIAMPDLEYSARFDNASLAGFNFNDGWMCILNAMNWLPFNRGVQRRQKTGPYDPLLVKQLAEANQAHNMDALRARVAALPNHYEFLKQNFYGGKD